MLESFDFPPPAFLRRLHDTYLEPTDVLVNLSPVDGLPVHCRVGGCANRIFRCHPLFPLSRFAGLSREERPEGSLPAFAWVMSPKAQLLSVLLRNGVRFLPRPLPAPLSTCL